jgi:hypothetical protein
LCINGCRLRFRPAQRNHVRALVDLEERRTSTDGGAFAEQHLVERSADARPQFDGVDRVDTAGVGRFERDVPLVSQNNCNTRHRGFTH